MTLDQHDEIRAEVTKAGWHIGPDLGSEAGPEPGLADIIYRYYRPHFDEGRSIELTQQYLAALSSPNTNTDDLARWQPIETCEEPTSPGSGDGVLIATADGIVGEAYRRNFGDDSDGWWWANTNWGDYPEPDRPIPIAWQSLPPAPEKARG